MDHEERADGVRQRYDLLRSVLDERQRRLWAASEAKAIGYGGVTLVARLTGISRRAIHAGLGELAAGPGPGRVRRPGAGRKPLTESQPDLLAALDMLVEPASRGDPESPLRWTCKSTRRLAEELRGQGFRVSRRAVADLLRAAGYSLQANRKTLEGAGCPDRNAQFEHIADRVKRHQRRGQPVVSVDTKKKELVGNFKNGGPGWRPVGHPTRVQVHDLVGRASGKAIPYGVYDLTANAGWVSVGTDHDTAAFATATIGRWWRAMGRPVYSAAAQLLVTAAGGGSNGWRSRLWKVCLQRLADESGLVIRVCHLPPGASKWNKIEHRLFGQISVNWRGQPLTSLDVIVRLIGATTTATGLTVRAAIDRGKYPAGIKVSDDELAAVNLVPEAFRGEWNYSIRPSQKS